MFAPGNLGVTPPKIPFYRNRALGILVLMVALILCLALVIGLDAAIFVPYNATSAVTQTWQAAHPEATRGPRRPPPATPGNPDLHSA